MPLVPIDGIRLMVEQAGEGEPLVLVHGSWDDRRVWAGVVPSLARHVRVVAYDRRGHTDSDDGRADGTRRDDEEDVAALVEALDLAPVHLVGNSFGALVALGVAARRPDLIRTLAVHEPPAMSLADDPAAADGFTAAAREVVEIIDGGDLEQAARVFVDDVSGQGPFEALADDERAMLIGNAGTFAGEARDPAWVDVDLDALAALDAPVLITTGDESPPPFPGIAHALRAALPQAELRVIPGAGHVPHETHPEEYAALIAAFAATPAARGR